MSKINPTHPGLSVLDHIEAMDWTVDKCADRLGVGGKELAQLLDGSCGISPAMALALERIGWSNADFWMRRQAYYDLAQERLRQTDSVVAS